MNGGGDDQPPPPPADGAVRRARERRVRAAAAAAAAAPRRRNEQADDGGEDEGEEEEAAPARRASLDLLVQRMSEVLGYNPAEAVEMREIRNMLEAAGGNVDLAASWLGDHIHAKLEQLGRNDNEREQEADEAAGAAAAAAAHHGEDDESEEEDEDDDDDDDDGGADAGDDARLVRQRRGGAPDVIREHDEVVNVNDLSIPRHDADAIARRLERQFAEHAPDEEEADDGGGEGDILPRAIARAVAAVRRPVGVAARRGGVAGGDDGDDAMEPPAGARNRAVGARNNNLGNDVELEQVRAIAARAAEAVLAAQQEGGEGGENNDHSVSVSDDESGGAWRRAAARLANAATASDSSTSSPRRKRRKSGTGADRPSKEAEDIDETGYLSDSDWLWEVSEPRPEIPVTPPSELLWYLNETPPTSGEVVTETANNATGSVRDGAVGVAAAATTGSNVIVDDDGDDEGSCGRKKKKKKRVGIPRTWLSAGFHLSGCATGLVVKPPNDDDFAYFTWQQRQQEYQQEFAPNNRRVVVPPPPYHCRAISAVLSVVTAMIHTGAASSSKSSEPFGTLDVTQRKRQFEARLADVLTALFNVAVKASLHRKSISLERLRRTNTDQWQKLQRKLSLCPTCSFQIDAASGDVSYSVDGDVQVVTSYTNVQDLRAYVLSNMGSFTSPGGCAMFLETIFRIHGSGAVKRMMSHSKRCGTSLIDCTCEERHLKKLQAHAKANDFNSSSSRGMFADLAVDTTPPNRDCISTELISLLLTGKVESTFQGWTTGPPLCFGLLSNKPGEVGKGLSRPEKPVWILRGPTCYSTLWLKQTYDNPDTFSRDDKPGAVAILRHWNCWYGQRNKTDFRLVLDSPQWTAPPLQLKKQTKDRFRSDTKGKDRKMAPVPPRETRTVARLMKRQQNKRKAEEFLHSTETVHPDMVFTEEELNRVVVHAADQKYYPGKYTMWRYDLGESASGENSTNDGGASDRKRRARTWTPFYRLSRREKLLVETLLGPNIKSIIMTRWPWATVDRFTPNDPPPTV